MGLDLTAARATVGAALSVPAVTLARSSHSWWQRAIAAVLLTAAVFAAHLLSRLGLQLARSDSVAPVTGLTRTQMAMAVAALTLFLTGLAFLFAALDRRAQRMSLRRMRRLADAAVEGLLMCEQGVVTDANAGLCALVGVPRERLRGLRLADLIVPEDRPNIPEAANDAKELNILSASGEPIPVEIVARDLGQGQQRVLAVRDLRERRSAEERIRHLAHHDPLTGVLNRVSFSERLHRALELAVATDGTLALLALNLDRFKDVNERFGDAAGDAVLTEVAQRVLAEIGPHDLVARLGGDDFVVVQCGAAQPDAAGDLADRLIESISQPFVLDGHSASIGVSVGICLFPHHATTAEALLSNADTALHRAKAGGGSRAHYFDADMDTAMRARRALADDLRKTLTDGGLHIHYQPQIDTGTGKVVAFEALLRWTHPFVGPVSPAEFIRIAEDYGIILDLGQWVLEQACAEAARWTNPLTLAVHVSPVQIRQGDLAERIAQVLKRTGLAATRLEIEVTETILVKDFHHALSVLRRIKALGVRVALDDFGTGYSSLATLQAFPFDKLKIDRSFVERLGTHPQAEGIVRAVLGLGRSLSIPVVAEGVETSDQAAFLRAEQCQTMQGYLFGRPEPIDRYAATTGADVEPARDAAAALTSPAA